MIRWKYNIIKIETLKTKGKQWDWHWPRAWKKKGNVHVFSAAFDFLENDFFLKLFIYLFFPLTSTYLTCESNYPGFSSNFTLISLKIIHAQGKEEEKSRRRKKDRDEWRRKWRGIFVRIHAYMGCCCCLHCHCCRFSSSREISPLQWQIF